MPRAVEHLAKPRLPGLLRAGAGTDAREALGRRPVDTDARAVVPFPALRPLVPVRAEPDGVVWPGLRQVPRSDGSVYSRLQLSLLGVRLGHGRAFVAAASLAGLKGITVADKRVVRGTEPNECRGGRCCSHCGSASPTIHGAAPLLLRLRPAFLPVPLPGGAIKGASSVLVLATPLLLRWQPAGLLETSFASVAVVGLRYCWQRGGPGTAVFTRPIAPCLAQS